MFRVGVVQTGWNNGQRVRRCPDHGAPPVPPSEYIREVISIAVATLLGCAAGLVRHLVKYYLSELKDDKDVIKAAVCQEGHALRFASDEEFVQLAQKAASENLTSKQIKQEIKNWRGDYYRV